MSDLIWLHDAVNVADMADYTGLSVEDVKKVTDEVVKCLKALQPVDAVPVVRCEDCKYYNKHKVMNCSYHINAVKENWFCSQGEKVKKDG